MSDPRYPIYHWSFRWEQDGEHDERYPNWHEGLPEGRIWNMTGFDRMYRTDPGLEAVEKDAREWWETYKASDKMKDRHVGGPEITVEFARNETWVLEWFGHRTFDVGQTDAEALASFGAFVERMRAFNREHGEVVNGYWREPYCLMGAEDRWRWCGATDDGEQAPAPCRCSGCKKLGVIRIGH